MKNARKAAIGYSTYVLSRRVVRDNVIRKLRREPPRAQRWRKPIAATTAAALAVAGAAGAVAVRRHRNGR